MPICLQIETFLCRTSDVHYSYSRKKNKKIASFQQDTILVHSLWASLWKGVDTMFASRSSSQLACPQVLQTITSPLWTPHSSIGLPELPVPWGLTSPCLSEGPSHSRSRNPLVPLLPEYRMEGHNRRLVEFEVLIKVQEDTQFPSALPVIKDAFLWLVTPHKQGNSQVLKSLKKIITRHVDQPSLL